MVSAYLREHLGEITSEWEREVRVRVPAVRGLARPALLDHMPEFLDSLAAWLDGDEGAAQRGFDALAGGHALQRLGVGVDLESLTVEYAVLREVIGRRLDGAAIDELVRLHVGIDAAIRDAITRYIAERDLTRDRFVSILGHDLRNPLGAIQMAVTALLGSEQLGARERRLGATIQRSSLRMQRMIEDVIQFARTHFGRGMPSEPSRADMGEIVQSVVDEMATAHPSRVIEVHREGDLRGTWDRDRVFQAISNLVANAIQHGDDPIVVSARVEDGDRAIVTTVANQGPPLPPEELPRVFDPFRQAPAVRSGLGLGLYIVQQIAFAHGATCDVESNERRTAFCIRWPRVPIEELPQRP